MKYHCTKKFTVLSLSLYCSDSEAPESNSSKGRSCSMSLDSLQKRNAGCAGVGRLEEWLLSIWTTEAIVGLAATFSWTHNSPIWMHVIISFLEHFPRLWSIRLEAVPSIQFFHAYKKYIIHVIKTPHTLEKVASLYIKSNLCSLMKYNGHTYKA